MRREQQLIPRVLRSRDPHDGSADFDFNNVSFKSYANTARQPYADPSCGSHGFDSARANEFRYNSQALRRTTRVHCRTSK